MKYIDKEGKEKAPVIIHRAILGSIERFIGILLEHHKGLLPICISPNQLAMVPISSNSDSQKKYIEKIQNELLQNEINIKIYNSDGSLNIRDKLKKENYQSSLNEFIEYLKEEMNVVV